jgi:hypothetical protein
MEAKNKRGNWTKISQETTSSLRVETTHNGSKVHIGIVYHHPTPFEGRKPQRRDNWQRDTQHRILTSSSTRRAPTN